MAKVEVTPSSGSQIQGSRVLVRTSAGIPYVIAYDRLNDGIEMWKGNGTTPTSFAEQDAADSPSATPQINDTAIACYIDSSDVIQVYYIEENGKSSFIGYATFDTSTDQWAVTGSVVNLSAIDIIVGSHISVAVDSNGVPHIAYTSEDSNMGSDFATVFYVNKVGGSWNTPLQVKGAIAEQNCRFPEIAIGADDAPVIVFSNVTSSDIEKAIPNFPRNNPTSFTISDVDSTAAGGTNQVSVVVAADGTHWFAGVDSDNSIIVYEGTTARDTGNTGTDPTLVAVGTDIYVFYEDTADNDIKYNRWNGTSWDGEVSLETGTYNNVKTKWAFVLDNDSGGNIVSIYSFNDSTPTDPDAVWSSDANAFDTNVGTFATVSTNGSVSTNFLRGDGTNAPSSGEAIISVQVRVNAFGSSGDEINVAVYTASLGELLGTLTLTLSATSEWGGLLTLSTPSGGWTWAKVQALEVKLYTTVVATVGVSRVDIIVRSAAAELDYTFERSDGDIFWNKLDLGGGVTEVTLTKSLKYAVITTPSTLTKSLKYTVITTPTTITKSLKYDISSLAEVTLTKSLTYSVTVTPATITKSLKYTVETTPAALTKSLTYKVTSTPSTLTKSLKYEVTATIAAITKSLQYLVTASVSAITKSLKYTVLTTPATVTKSLKYDVVTTPTALTKSLTYAVITETAPTKSLTYRVLTTIAPTKSLNYIVINQITIQKSLKYTVIVTPAALTKSLTYAVETTPTAVTKSLTYRVVVTPATVTKSLKYEVTSTQSVTKSLNYLVTAALSVTKSLQYDIEGVSEVTVQKSLKYTVLTTPTTLTKSLTYMVIVTPTTLTKSLKYTVVITPTTLTKSLKYTVIVTPIALTKSIKYTILTTPTALTKSMQYLVAAVLSVTKSLKYTVVTTPATLTKSLKYTVVVTPTSLTKSLTYRVVSTPTTITKSLKYEVTATLSITKSLRYDIQGITEVTITKNLKYTVVITPTVLTKSLKYTIVLTPATIAKLLKYEVTAEVSITKSLTYDVVVEKAITKSLQYVVALAPVTITKSLSYEVVVAISVTKSLQYVVTKSVVVAKSLKYAVRITPFTQGLVGYWRMDEDPAIHNTSIIDESGEGNSGVLNTGDGATNKSVAGKFNRAITFDGIDDYVALGNPVSLQITETITLSAWIKSNDKSEKKRIINKLDSGAGQQSYTLFTGTNGKVIFKFWTGGVAKSVSSTTDIVDGNWHQVIATYDGSSMRIYIDGVLEATTSSITGAIDNDSSNVDIGRKADNNQFFNGQIDDVRIYNRALSSEEVLSLFQGRIKSLRYVVLTPTSAITKGLEYTVETSTSVTKSLKYIIVGTPTTITKSLQYYVLVDPYSLGDNDDYTPDPQFSRTTDTYGQTNDSYSIDTSNDYTKL